jgi:hypothetical protein
MADTILSRGEPRNQREEHRNFFSAEYCRRVAGRMSLTRRSDDGLALSGFWLIFTPRWLR